PGPPAWHREPEASAETDRQRYESVSTTRQATPEAKAPTPQSSPRHSISSEASEARNIISAPSTRARQDRNPAAAVEIHPEPFTPKTITIKEMTTHRPIESPPVRACLSWFVGVV